MAAQTPTIVDAEEQQQAPGPVPFDQHPDLARRIAKIFLQRIVHMLSLCSANVSNLLVQMLITSVSVH